MKDLLIECRTALGLAKGMAERERYDTDVYMKTIKMIDKALRKLAVIKSLPDSDEIRMKARELDEKDFAQWMWELQKSNVL